MAMLAALIPVSSISGELDAGQWVGLIDKATTSLGEGGDWMEFDDALERLLVSYARVAFSAADLIVVVTENRGALPRSEVPRLRRRDRRVTDVWRAVVGSVRPELRRDEVTMLVRSVLALINGFPRGAPDALPPVEAVTPLASAFVRG